MKFGESSAKNTCECDIPMLFLKMKVTSGIGGAWLSSARVVNVGLESRNGLVAIIQLGTRRYGGRWG